VSIAEAARTTAGTRSADRHALVPIAHAASVPIDAAAARASDAQLARAGLTWHPAGPAQVSAAMTRTVPGTVAKILPDGFAAAPLDAPAAVQRAIWTANELIGLPYIYGGGHGSFYSDGYDCSGTVSYALHGGGFISRPFDSMDFFGFGVSGQGHWITVYTDPAHAFLEIAGIRLDTSADGQIDGASGPRWRPLLTDTSGYVARHPVEY
jgi:hypothetical protein